MKRYHGARPLRKGSPKARSPAAGRRQALPLSSHQSERLLDRINCGDISEDEFRQIGETAPELLELLPVQF